MVANLKHRPMTPAEYLAADPENPVLELASIDFSCPLALVYEEVELNRE